MIPIRSHSELTAILDQPAPVACLDDLGLEIAGQTLDDLLRLSLSPGTVTWRDGGVSLDRQAVALARLRAAVRHADGRATDEAWLAALPAGRIDRLLDALDRANGYRAPSAGEALGGWVEGLLPRQPEAALFVGAYDFATLMAAEAASLVPLPGGEMRLDAPAYPLIIAAAVRAGDTPEAPPLLDAATARRLPCGAARAIVERADALSEIGGPSLAIRFPDQPAPSRSGAAGAVAPASYGPVPVGAARRAAG